MARPFRKEKVASAIRQVVGEAILHRLADPRVAPLTAVTRVEMSPDLLIARIYLSVPGGETVEICTLNGVRHATGFLQRVVAGAVPMRNCPQLRFEMDNQIKAIRQTMALLADNVKEDVDLCEPELMSDTTGKKETDSSTRRSESKLETGDGETE